MAANRKLRFIFIDFSGRKVIQSHQKLCLYQDFSNQAFFLLEAYQIVLMVPTPFP